MNEQVKKSNVEKSADSDLKDKEPDSQKDLQHSANVNKSLNGQDSDPYGQPTDGEDMKGAAGGADDQTDHMEDKTSINDSNMTSCCSCFQQRYLISTLTGVGLFLVYVMRTNIGVTAIALLDEAPHTKVGTFKAMLNLPDVTWTTTEVGLLHSMFFMGYLLTHIPGGYLTTIYPSHRLFGCSILSSAVLNLLLPICIQDMPKYTPCVVRFLQGMGEGLLYPACYGVLRHWSIQKERGRVVSMVLTGTYVGPIIGFPLAGIITHNIGWQYVFYACGGACVVWYFVWLVLAYEKPSHSRLISDQELEFFERAQGDVAHDYANVKPPWKAIFTSLPVLSLCLCHFARYWLFTLMITNEPFFLNTFGFTIQQNGFASALPHVVKVIMAIVGGFICDFLLTNSYVTTTVVRKFFTAFGYGGVALFLLLLTLTQQPIADLVFLTLAIGLFGLSVPGWQINHYDLSARYAGILVSITSAFGTIGAIIVPLVTAVLTANKSKAGWNEVFYITISVMIVATISYLIFGSGEEQPWAKPPKDVKIIHKIDPLARRPMFKTVPSQPKTKDKGFTGSPGPESYDPKSKVLHRLSKTLAEKLLADEK